MKVTPCLLIILDGYGCRKDHESNAVAGARKPNWDGYWAKYPHLVINASEASVGLPTGQMGNSEVGHLNIGAGRVVYQEFTRIDRTIASGSFFTNPALRKACALARNKGKTLHVMGLLSDGGVHSHEHHIHAMIELAAREKTGDVCVHAFLDGRDTPPKSARRFLENLERKCKETGTGRIASIIGRYYAMDRDHRWQRVKAAYDLLTGGRGEFVASSAVEGLEMAYARGETDEFIKATAIVPEGMQPARMKDGDTIAFMNFRSDRARQISRTFIEPDFDGFAREHRPRLAAYCTLTGYSDEFAADVAFPPERVKNGFGEYIARLGLNQLRIAETEKYPHVTFFFNGGEETAYPGEDRILVPSPDVATYDLKPEMSAFEVAAKLVDAINAKKYDVIICNFANADMVGHTGNLDAARRAIEAVDICLGRVVPAMLAVGGEVLITADHGNAELMQDQSTGESHTAHTLNLVPFLYVGRRRAELDETGALEDVAPTMLKIMGLQQPPEMTGHPLVRFE